MLNITYKHIDDAGSCNLCSRGILNKSGTNLNFPYNHVFVIRGNSIAIVICRGCIKEIKEI